MTITAIAFYILGRSNDAKKQQVEFHKKWKDLEKKKHDEVLGKVEDAMHKKNASISENVLNFEEKKHKILRDAKKVSTEDFLKSKGIKREE
jgi:hypothetical protein